MSAVLQVSNLNTRLESASGDLDAAAKRAQLSRDDLVARLARLRIAAP